MQALLKAEYVNMFMLSDLQSFLVRFRSTQSLQKSFAWMFANSTSYGGSNGHLANCLGLIALAQKCT